MSKNNKLGFFSRISFVFNKKLIMGSRFLFKLLCRFAARDLTDLTDI